MSVHHFKMPCNSIKHYDTLKNVHNIWTSQNLAFWGRRSGYALMTFWVFNCFLTNLGHLRHLDLLHTTVYSLLPNENLALSSRLVLYDIIFGEKGGVWILTTQHVVLRVEHEVVRNITVPENEKHVYMYTLKLFWHRYSVCSVAVAVEAQKVEQVVYKIQDPVRRIH